MSRKQVNVTAPETHPRPPHRGEILYRGGEGPLYLPNGNPDGTGVNLCKITAAPIEGGSRRKHLFVPHQRIV
jgi:hypothetical protein